MNKNNIALLIGNDINNINNSTSWKNLLKGIIGKLNLTKEEVDIKKVKSKPFPLLYEEMFLRALGKKKLYAKEELERLEKQLKIFIAEKTKSIQYNSIHEKIMSLDIKDIMTTNYEYSFYGNSGYRAIESGRDLRYIKESKYSIFRYNEVLGKRIWHIHGECDNPRSIILGYEQYAGFLQKMRNYVVTGTNYKTQEKNLPPLEKRINSDQLKDLSWIDLFFTKNIHIFGLSLDTSEIDLWWLLAYRARLFLQKKIEIKENEITYYYPSKYKKKSREKLELFESVQVNTVEINEEEKEKYYLEILNKISKNMKSD